MAKGDVFFNFDIEQLVYKYYLDKEDTENIIDVIEAPINNCILFADPHNFPIRYWASMVDLSSREQLPQYTNTCCWWDRHTFATHPLGLPVSRKGDAFETDGVFCSFGCMKAYLLENIKNIRYKNSMTLILVLYKLLFQRDIETITPSPHWKLLSVYGGHLDIMDLRKAIGNTVYEETINEVKMQCSSRCFKEVN